MRTEFLCISVLRVASGPRVKLASSKSALNPTVVCSTDRSKAVVPVLVLLFVALWFILRGDLLYVFPCVVLFLCFLEHVESNALNNWKLKILRSLMNVCYFTLITLIFSLLSLNYLFDI